MGTTRIDDDAPASTGPTFDERESAPRCEGPRPVRDAPGNLTGGAAPVAACGVPPAALRAGIA